MAGNVILKTITNSLVLYLDAVNIKSYPGSGNNWFDLTGNMNTGTLTNGATFSTSNGGSILLDGVNDYVQVEPITSLTATSYTISIWVKPISTGGLDLGFGTLLGYSGSRRLLWNLGSKSILAQMGGSGVTSTSNSVPVNTWSYITFIYDISLNKEYLYINGVYNAIANNTSSNFNLKFYLGYYGDPNYYWLNGNISMIHIYNRRLSDLEILQNYNSTKSRFD
jgi:hypothetical protein